MPAEPSPLQVSILPTGANNFQRLPWPGRETKPPPSPARSLARASAITDSRFKFSLALTQSEYVDAQQWTCIPRRTLHNIEQQHRML